MKKSERIEKAKNDLNKLLFGLNEDSSVEQHVDDLVKINELDDFVNGIDTKKEIRQKEVFRKEINKLINQLLEENFKKLSFIKEILFFDKQTEVIIKDYLEDILSEMIKKQGKKINGLVENEIQKSLSNIISTKINEMRPEDENW